MNSNLASGGGTDDTNALQTLLDYAANGRDSVHLILDGAALVSGLRIHSNTTLEGEGENAGLFLKASSNRPVLQGANPTKTERLNANITLRNLYINGNGSNQTDAGIDGTYNHGIVFYGARDLTLSELHMHDSRIWGIGIWNGENVLVEDHTHTIIPGSTRISQDAIDIRAGSEHVVIRNCNLNTYDDAIAVNAKDYQGRNDGGPYVTQGAPISDVLIENVVLNDVLFGIAIYSKSFRVDGITIRNVSATTRHYWLSINSYPVQGDATQKGNFGTITAEDVVIAPYSTPNYTVMPYDFDQYIHIEANVETLTLTNVTHEVAADGRPDFRVLSGYTVTTCTLNNVNAVNNGVSQALNIVLDGAVTHQLGDSW